MQARVLILVASTAAVVDFMLGCAPPDSAPAEWTDVTDSTAVRTLVESPSICDDCIILKQVVVMGDTAGPGFVVEAMAATRDSLGNYWVGQTDAVKVFDAAGRFVRQVGRAGQGPLEFGRFPAPLYTDADGRVHIHDRGNLRETIVGTDYELYADRRLPGRVQAAAPLSGGRLVVNLLLPTNGSAGFPLHIVEGPEVLHSFGGSVDESPRLPSQFTSRRLLATDRSGHVFSARWYDYVIEAWTEDGRRITGFEGPTLNEAEVQPAAFSGENPPPNQLFAIRADDVRRLWVLSWHRRDGWSDALEEARRRQSGNEVLNLLFTGRIEVIDLNSGSIIARRDGEELIGFFVGDGLGLETQYLENGTPRLVIWSIALDAARGP